MRLGDDHPVDGVRGRLEAQIGAPRIVLANGATDHFGLEHAAWIPRLVI